MSESFSGSEFELVEPDPAALIESLRAFGYNVQTAVADLIDNSITAGSTHIWVDFHWGGPKSRVVIKDNGRGMSANTLREALRMGSTNPTGPRDSKDLGRFGLGLKTASFSQARRLIVSSRSSGEGIAIRHWDLDHVAATSQWQLLLGAPAGSLDESPWLSGVDSGTVVAWESLDRIVDDRSADDPAARKYFYEIVEAVENHIAMVFHRFLSRGSPELTIEVNGNSVEAWDPFLENHSATQRLPLERIPISGGIVRVTPFVLPHNSRLSPEEHGRASGVKGWNAHQGFYVYRADRLLVPGIWFHSDMKAEEHHKLARIALDITQEMDHDWNLDVRKSSARPPAALRGDLQRIARTTRRMATEVYRHRGKRISKRVGDQHQVWDAIRKDEAVRYRVNRKHAAVRLALELPRESRRRVTALIQLIERTVPIATISIDAFENPNGQVDEHRDLEKDVLDMAKEILEIQMRKGETLEHAKVFLLALEPFGYYPEVVEALGEGME